MSRVQLKRKDLSIAICILIIVTSRIATYFAFPQGFRSPDTMSYFSGEFLNFDLVSLTGHSSRGWVVPLLFAFMPNGSAVIVLQLALSALAWAHLILTFSKVLHDQKTRSYVLICTTVLASAPQIIQHDTVLLATSITNSMFIFLISLLTRVLYVKHLSTKGFAILLLVGTMLMIQKTSFIPIVIGMISLALYSKWRQANLAKRSIVSLLILAAIVYSLILGGNVNSSWQVSYSGQTLLWQLGGQSPVSAQFAQHLNLRGAPQCITTEAPYQNLDSSIGKILNNCPAGTEFLQDGIQKEFINFLASNPKAIVDLVVLGAGASSSNSSTNYGGAVSLFPKFFSEAFFGTTMPNIAEYKVEDQVEGMNLINSGKPFWIVSPIFGWLLIAFVGFLRRKSLEQEERTLYVALLFTLSQAALVVLLLPSEWVRQTSPFTTGILILCIYLSSKTIVAIFDSVTKRGS